jgi:hypothetical protein
MFFKVFNEQQHDQKQKMIMVMAWLLLIMRNSHRASLNNVEPYRTIGCRKKSRGYEIKSQSRSKIQRTILECLPGLSSN